MRLKEGRKNVLALLGKHECYFSKRKNLELYLLSKWVLLGMLLLDLFSSQQQREVESKKVMWADPYKNNRQVYTGIHNLRY